MHSFFERIPLFLESWPEHILIDQEQKSVGDFFFIFTNFLLATPKATRFANFSIVELQSIVLALKASTALRKQLAKQNIVVLDLHFITFLLIISLWEFPRKKRPCKFLPGGQP